MWCGLRRALIAGGALIPVAYAVTAMSAAKRAKAEDPGPLPLFRRDRGGDELNAQVELPRDYSFRHPAGWEARRVSRTDADAYGTDARVAGRGGKVEVAVFPFEGAATAEGMKGFLMRARLGEDADMHGASLVRESQTRGRHGPVFHFATEGPATFLAAAPVGRALYVCVGTASSPRELSRVGAALEASVASFDVL